MNSSDKHFYKIVTLAAIFAILIYFQRKTVHLDKVENFDYAKLQRSKFIKARAFDAERSWTNNDYKVRGLKWILVANHTNRTNKFRDESGTGSGDSADAEAISKHCGPEQLDQWQTVQTLMRHHILLHLIWVYTACSGLSVQIYMCSDVHSLPADQRCGFVNRTDDCQIDEGFIDYTYFVYCDFSTKLLPLALIVLIFWWLFLFIGLAVTADDFFCPALAVISDTMRLSHNIAGVTFLAFGNGAPDIFSAIAAIGNAKNGDAGLAFGALFGAGVFVTTVVAGTIAIIQPFDAMQRPFLRDVIFFLGATFWAFQILWKKEITKYEAIGFILLYVLYVLVVVLGRYIHTRNRNRSSSTSNIQESLDSETNARHLRYPTEDNSTEEDVANERSPLINNSHRVNGDPEVTEFIPSHDYGPGREFLNSINPIDVDGWSDKNLFKKIYEIFKCPLMFCLIVTVPVVNYEDDKHHWNRHLYCLQCVLGPLFSVVATKVGFTMLGGHFPAWALTLLLGIALAALVFFTSKNEEQPKYHAAFAYLGFVVAVVWIYSIANEIVNILQTFGVVFSISNAILGLTLLAWGNSLGDFIADTVMARQGFPRMGISACFGGPLFNLLLGVGIPFTIATIKNGSPYQLKITLEEVVLAGFVCLSLISSLIIVPLSRFRMSRPWGIYLVVLYIIFLIVAILTETGVIHAVIDGNSE